MSMKLTFIEGMIIVGIGLILASAIDAAMRQSRERPAPVNGDNTECIGGIAYYRGEVLIVNSNTVKCQP